MKLFNLLAVLLEFLALAIWHLVILEQQHTPTPMILLTANTYLLTLLIPFARATSRT